MINMENREEIKQYSLEWYKEMRKLNKDTIISLVESNGKQRDDLKEQNKQLLDEIEMLKELNATLQFHNIKYQSKIDQLQFELKAADSVNENLSEFKEDIIKAMDSELDCIDTCYKIDEIISNLTNQNK